MANTGVILYSEQETILELLSNEQRGILLTALFSLAKGETPQIEDKVVAMAFKIFQMRQDWNNIHYDDVRKARSEAGKRGGAPKGNKNASKNNQETTEEQPNDNQSETEFDDSKSWQMVTNDNKSWQMVTNDNKAITKQAKQAKTSKNNQNKPINININKNIIHSKTNVLSCVKDAHADTREEYGKELIQDENFAERTAMNFHVAAEDILILVNSFNNEQAVKGVAHVDYNDYRRHAYDWIRIQIEKKEKERKHGNPIDNIREAQERQIARLNKIAARDGGVLEAIPEPF